MLFSIQPRSRAMMSFLSRTNNTFPTSVGTVQETFSVNCTFERMSIFSGD